VKIPIAWVLEFDDLGWDDGRDLFYYKMAKMEFTDSSIVIDLSEVEKNKVDCHKNEMMISFKKGVVPVSCAGAKSRFTKNTRISKRIKSHIKTKQLKFWFKT
jgi:hypothetical protein